jgi:hypothetical protein
LFKQKLRRRAVKSTEVSALNKLSPYEIILGPVFTEKTMNDMEKLNKYFFKVH